MEKEIINKSAPVIAKLLNVARSENVDPNLILIRYCQEKFLYRLSISKYCSNFCLKGGLLLIYLDVPNNRPTKDIDFLAKKISHERKGLEKIIADIASLNCDDGIIFIIESISSENIVEASNYPGVRIKISALISKAKVTIKIDLAWGDIVKPEVKEIDFPTILTDELTPRLCVYSTESIMSEKFETAVNLMIINSRMKDFYDMYILSQSQNFKAKSLKNAIKTTFANRETNLKDDYIFGVGFSLDKRRQKQWAAFLHKHRLKNVPSDFSKIMDQLAALLKPLVASIINQDKIDGTWNSTKSIWEFIN